MLLTTGLSNLYAFFTGIQPILGEVTFMASRGLIFTDAVRASFYSSPYPYGSFDKLRMSPQFYPRLPYDQTTSLRLIRDIPMSIGIYFGFFIASLEETSSPLLVFDE